MSDLRTRFGFILAIALFPILLFSIYMAFSHGRLTLVAISILAWVFAYFAIWASTDKLVFSFLARIQATSDLFAAGDLNARVGPLENAPTRIAELAAAFDDMADNVSRRDARLRDNLDEKETLLREIHHRVKNNLQIIISLLNLQQRKLDGTEGQIALKETSNRINAIALVHKGLYEGDDLRIIDMEKFLTRLIDQLKTGLNSDDQNISILTDIQAVWLEPDTAIPVSLFIVEALTNAIRHGVDEGGTVSITLESIAKEIHVSVIDDGEGLTENFQVGMGSKLIKGFARQVSGHLVRTNLPRGHKVSLVFETPKA